MSIYTQFGSKIIYSLIIDLIFPLCSRSEQKYLDIILIWSVYNARVTTLLKLNTVSRFPCVNISLHSRHSIVRNSESVDLL